MQLYSTNDTSRSQTVSFQEAVFQSLPADNGLYMPTELPQLDDAFFNEIEKFTFPEIAFQVATALLDDEIPALKLRDLIEDAIDFPAPVVALDEEVHVLELFHGPTLAFKDFGARFMARTMSWFLQQSPAEQERTILVATSGDTGSAVAQGFLNVPGINVVLLYPSGKVSEIQEKQLTTVGNNVAALEVSGTFDDCQRMVKEAFLDQELRKEVALSSANSINISRLIPQSFYYFNAYAQLKRDLAYNPDWRLVFSVPSGNFGNLCGGLIAQQMGLPIDHIVAATNTNDVVPKYLETGKFTPRPSVQTISNAMDVGNPSNFARLQAFYGYAGSDEELLDSIQEDISGNRFSDDATKQAIREVYENYYGYTMCPHTAVGYLGLKDYLEKQPGRMNGVVLATAHPAKFKDTVEEAVGESIFLPETLQAALNQPKQVTSISPDYEALKAYLMDR
ncbi:threonine synthase [Tunicatimonas pelagia]|uniref:threonine synthase n=1 Tax=Tunicatimonas pelagia TaxID=931531 RepID=UPI002667157B|nr:threonine synthase [Tunicatimonas pelagia]WKN46252.1 threonine synthase [Tunicatimonas pelagia]